MRSLFSGWRRSSSDRQQRESDVQDFADAAYPLVRVLFSGEWVYVKLRKLNQAQILSLGDFSLIETFQDKIRRKELERKLTMREVVAYAERHHQIVMAALVSPTYDEVVQAAGVDPRTEEKREELKRLRELLRETPEGKERRELEERIDSILVWVDLILPEDFTAMIVGFTLGLDESDIKAVSEEMLIQAAVLAERGHDNPADHIDGRFTAFNRDDINRRAWVLLNRFREEKKRSGAVADGG